MLLLTNHRDRKFIIHNTLVFIIKEEDKLFSLFSFCYNQQNSYSRSDYMNKVSFKKICTFVYVYIVITF